MSNLIALADIRARRSPASQAAEEVAADAAACAAAREALQGFLGRIAAIEGEHPGLCVTGVGLNELLRGAMIARLAEGYDRAAELVEHVAGLAEVVASEAAEEVAP